MRTKIANRILIFLIAGVALFGMIGLGSRMLVSRFIRTLTVSGTSMSPGLNKGDKVFVYRISCDIQRGRIVAFCFSKKPADIFLSRVVGLPGDVFELRKGKVLLNASHLEAPYV